MMDPKRAAELLRANMSIGNITAPAGMGQAEAIDAAYVAMGLGALAIEAMERLVRHGKDSYDNPLYLSECRKQVMDYEAARAKPKLADISSDITAGDPEC